jgi:hypothetical protein
MDIEVGPARRPGHTTEIYSGPLAEADMKLEADGDLTLTLNACGINCKKSLYRYRIRLTASDIRKLSEAGVAP